MAHHKRRCGILGGIRQGIIARSLRRAPIVQYFIGFCIRGYHLHLSRPLGAACAVRWSSGFSGQGMVRWRLAIEICMLPNRLMEFAIAFALLAPNWTPKFAHKGATANDCSWSCQIGDLHCRSAENMSFSILDVILPPSARIRKLAGTGIVGTG